MDLSVRQTRQLTLAGTVPFPRPFPAAGVVSFQCWKLAYESGADRVSADMIVVEEPSRGEKFLTRAIVREYVTALFVPGVRRPDGSFRISRKRQVSDLERGEWFMGRQIDPDHIRATLRLPDGADVQTSDSALRGIVFVAEKRPVTTVTLRTAPAEEVLDSVQRGCTCERYH